MTRPYRSCHCREDGKLLGARCPRLATDSRHERWFARYEAPGTDGRRRQPRLGPFDTQREASEALTEALGNVRSGMHAPDRTLTTGAYLAAWLEDKRPELKPRTWSSYEETARLYLVPGLGHIRSYHASPGEVRSLWGVCASLWMNCASTQHGDAMPGEVPGAAPGRPVGHLPAQMRVA